MVKKVNDRKKLNESYEEYYFNGRRKNSNLYDAFDLGTFYMVNGLEKKFSDLEETLSEAIETAKESGEPCIIIEQKFTPICYVGDEDLYYTYKK